MKSLFDLSDRDIWVIGGAGYLGTAVIKSLAAQGATVLCADLPGRAAAMVAREGLRESVSPKDLDAGDQEAVVRFVREEITTRGVPHGLVVMTYRSFAKPMEELLPAEFDEANRVGLTGTFLLARETGQAMAREGRGSVLLFSSMYGSVSPDPAIYPPPLFPNPIEYGVGKAGIQQMARYLAVHWGPQNVRCNSISPGPFPFPSLQKDNPDFLRQLEKKCPLGRVGRSEEMAGSVVFLLSDASTYVTGHNLAVDGGWTAW